MKGSDAALRASVLETALFLEDVFGLRLSDCQMSESVLGNESAIRACVAERLPGAGEEESASARTRT